MKRKRAKRLGAFIETYLGLIGIAVLVIGIALIFIAPYVFTQFSTGYDLSDKGQIGDTIAGTTAPIVGLVGSVLVFLSLYAQIEANKALHREFDEERKRDNFRMLMELVRSINDDIQRISIYSSKGRIHEGPSAIRFILRTQFNGGKSHSFPILDSLVIGLRDSLEMAEAFDLTDAQKRILQNQINGVWSKVGVHLVSYDNKDLLVSPLAEFFEVMKTIVSKAEELTKQPPCSSGS